MKSRSPDRRHVARLNDLMEIRMGSPQFGTLELDGRVVAGRSFGEHLAWSPDSRYLATQELLGAGTGPHTRVVVFDVETGGEIASERVRSGFAEPRHYEEGLLVYTRTFYGRDGETVEQRELMLPDRHA